MGLLSAGDRRTAQALPNHYHTADAVGDALAAFKAEGLFIFRDFLRIEDGDVIGQGHYGYVHKAVLNYPMPTEVAVKTVSKHHRATKNSSKLFLEEALTMKQFHHVNVLSLIGVSCKRNGMPMIVTPYMKHGDLLSYIQNEENFPKVKDLIGFGVQIAEGMKYLSSINYVHRDLAARNCLLAEEMTIKIADFGLTRDMYEKAYYKGNDKTALPIKWMAIESLKNYKFTLKSDVWSYGVVLWELITRGASPYPDVKFWNMKQYLEAGHRLQKPAYCPNGLYSIMKICWKESPEERPDFESILSEVKSLLENLHNKIRFQRISTAHNGSVSENVSDDEEPISKTRVSETLR